MECGPVTGETKKMSFMKNYSKIATTLCAVSLCSACERPPEPTETNGTVIGGFNGEANPFDRSRVPVVLKDQSAVSFAKGSVLPWRSQHYSASAVLGADRKLPRPVFVAYTDDQARQRLLTAHKALFGNVAAGKPTDRGEGIGLDLAEGMAWVAKDSGAITLRRKGEDGISSVVGPEHAVQLAAAQMAALGLFRLSEHESLDLIGVNATMSASWDPQPDGSMAVVLVFNSALGKDVTEYVSGHTVIFGRRYRGVPIEGGSLKAVLDAKGTLVGVLQEWREISGETPDGIAIDPDAVVESRRNPATANLKLESRICGYFEDSFVGRKQTSPGVGCLYRNVVPGERGLGRLSLDFVTMTSDASVPLTGTPLVSEQQ